jgi:CHAD domain-containing protein
MAQAVALGTHMSMAQAQRCVLSSCLDQIGVNASQMASGDHDEEHVHQLRVGLRRLRTALRFFDGALDDSALDEGATGLFRCLSAARDQAAVTQPLERTLARVAAGIGMGYEAPVAAAPADAPDAPSPEEAVRSAAAQALLLNLLARVHDESAPPATDAAALRDELSRRLNGWHRKVIADAKRFAELDDTGRHTLRKRAKRLRYAAEFMSALYRPRDVRRYLKPLRALQDLLGQLTDTMVALAAYRASVSTDAHAWFALGWLAARREQLLADCLPALAAFGKVKRFWKG